MRSSSDSVWLRRTAEEAIQGLGSALVALSLVVVLFAAEPVLAAVVTFLVGGRTPPAPGVTVQALDGLRGMIHLSVV